VKVRPVDPTEPLRSPESPRRAREASPPTLQTLRLIDLEERWRETPDAVLASLDGLWRESGERRYLAAEAELALRRGRTVADADPDRATAWYLLSALRAGRYLFHGPESPLERAFSDRFHHLHEVYDAAVGNFVRLRRELDGTLRSGPRDAVFETVELRVEVPGSPDGDGFDQLRPTRGLRVRGVRNHHRRDGVGATLVALRENRHHRPIDRFLPPEGIVQPLTAVITDGDEPGVATLALLDPRRTERIEAGGWAVPLAADFTTPYAYLLGLTNYRRVEIAGLLDAERTQWRQGIYLLEPYDPRKIPVLMIHGLFSSPVTWAELTNDLQGDPRLRDAYQVWHAFYSTGYPFLYSAAILRQELGLLERTVDPEGDDPATRSMVVIGHSMGGLIARTLVTDSGTALWEVLFQTPPDELEGSSEELELLRRTFLFEPRPEVDEVIFISTPHRGSELAGGFVGRLGTRLAQLPQALQAAFQELVTKAPGCVRPEAFASLQRETPDSILGFARDNPLLTALAERPIAPGVRYHTILGDRGKGADENGVISDGLVSYESAHLEGAASELLVPAGHDAHSHPVTIVEVKRILRRHLNR
jgi:pimeloyl-ACP methyl ester carboxylesterase